MKKKYITKASMVLGILFLLLILANLGVNFWMKNKLPELLKNNTAYIITYKTLNVELSTGNIIATGITVNSKNPQNQNVIGLQGAVDTVSISRLGIFDAVFRKRINSSDLVMRSPHLNITLAKPINDKTGKKRNPIVLKNVKISNGNISVFRPTKQKFLSVQDLNLNVENLQMTEESMEKKLPIVFDQYAITAKNFFFRPDNVYAFTAKNITTNEGQMNIKDFAMVPLLSFKNFQRFYPKKKSLFEIHSSEMEFKDIALKDNKISLTNVSFQDPKISINTTQNKAAKKEKDFTYDVSLENVLLVNAEVAVLKPNQTPLFSATNLNMKIGAFLMNNETVQQKIPFAYQDFSVKGNNVSFFSDTQSFKIAHVNLSPKIADFSQISVKPFASTHDRTSMDLDITQLHVKINEAGFQNQKLKVDISNVAVDGVNGKIISPTKPQKKKNDFSKIQLPLLVRNLVLKNANLQLVNPRQNIVFNQLNATVTNLEMNEKTIHDKIPFKTGSYSLTTKNFAYKLNQFYLMSIGLLKQSNNKVEVNNFTLKPLVSRSQFILQIPAEKDLYDLSISQITANGDWDLVSERKHLNASNITLNGVNANIFRSKIPKDDLSEKLMYPELLRSIKFPLFVQNLEVKNSILVYEEDTKKSDGPGKLTFGNFNLNAKNLNSGKMKGKPTLVPIAIDCRFMNVSPMKVRWNFDTAKPNDAFGIAGNIRDLPASNINPFIEPYLKIRAEGFISDLQFDFNGNKYGINGTMKMQHQNLKVALLRQTGEKNKMLSAIANVFVKSNSGDYPESVTVENVERDKTKSFFNLFWKGIELGLKKILIGKNAPKTEEKIKNTVENTKHALEQNKKDLQETKTEVKEKVQTIKQKVKDTKENVKKEGTFRNLFRKKSEK